jgi:hypothetical protein
MTFVKGALYGNMSWIKTRYATSLSTTNPTWNGLGSNWGIRRKSPLTNSTEHGTTLFHYLQAFHFVFYKIPISFIAPIFMNF